MKIDVKPFKTWEEQVEILNEWGNNCLNNNPIDREKAFNYLKTNNFQVCVDSFAPLLWKNLDDGINEKNLKFIDEFQFNDLVELFNFDNYLKNIVNELLQKLERRLRTGIIYHTLKAINSICKDIIDFPFILLDDNWSQIIGKSLFSNNLSNQSFYRNEDFQFQEYYSFLIKYIEPFDTGSLFAKSADVKRFYFCKVSKINHKLEICNNFNQYKFDTDDVSSSIVPLEIEDMNGRKILCTYNEFFKWCNANMLIKGKGHENEISIKNKVVRGMINALAKSFVPLYKSFTQETFGDMIKFFSKLNEKIQINIIREHFPVFYQKVTSLIQNDKNSNLILIGTFVSLLDVFKDLRNKIAHLDILYNFWDLHTAKNSSASKVVPIKENEFWITNEPTCNFLNNQLMDKNNNFYSNYFKNDFAGKKTIYYIDKINDLKIKDYCWNKVSGINYVKKSNEPGLWHLPIFFLNDTIDWLCIFTDNEKSFNEIINQCLLINNISNDEIRNRLHDYLFNKIIISLEKVDDNN